MFQAIDVFAIRLVVGITLIVAWSQYALTSIQAWQQRTVVEPEGSTQRLEQFLESRGLERLLLVQVETELARQPAGQAQSSLVQKLARLYQQQLLSSDWETQDEEMLDRAINFLKVYPQVNSTGLKLAIAHAQYSQIEGQFREWWFRGAPSAGREKLLNRLTEISADLEELRRQLDREFQDKLVLSTDNDAQAEARARRMSEIESQMLHIDYLLGWSNFFLGIGSPQNPTWLEQSARRFHTFLQLPPDDSIQSIDAVWFDLPTGWHVRSLIGLAMNLRARGDKEASEFCFQLVEQKARESEARRLLDIWKLDARVFARQWNSARDFAVDFDAAELSGRQQQYFWTSVIQSSGAVRRASVEMADDMKRAGLVGLLRVFDATLINQLLEEQVIELAGDRFLSTWARGFLLYDRAIKSNGDLDEARSQLESAIQAGEPDTDALDIQRCRYLVASIDYRKGDLLKAARQFAAVASELRMAVPRLAEEASWMRIRALSALSLVNDQYLGEAFAAMDQFLGWFPNSSHLGQLQFERLKLSSNWLPAEQAVERLSGASAKDPFHNDIQFELVRNQYRLWKKYLKEKSQYESGAFQQLLDFDKELQDNLRSNVNRRLRSMLIVFDARLQRNGGGPETRQALQAASDLANSKGVNPELQSQLDFHQMKLARESGDDALAIQLARKLATEAKGSRFEMSALIFLCQQYGDLVELGDDDLKSAIKDYQRLVELLGTTPEQLESSRNARVSLYRLVQLRLRDGQWQAAESGADQLVRSFPDRQEYLLTAARIKTRLKRDDQALPLWRKLAAGVQAGTDSWYESKYELARCLQKTDLAGARQLIRQTIQLSPQLPPVWQDKYELLSRQLDQTD